MTTMPRACPSYLVKTYRAIRGYISSYMSYVTQSKTSIDDEFYETLERMLNEALPKDEIDKVTAEVIYMLSSINPGSFTNYIDKTPAEPFMLWAKITPFLHRVKLYGKVYIRKDTTGFIVQKMDPSKMKKTKNRNINMAALKADLEREESKSSHRKTSNKKPFKHPSPPYKSTPKAAVDPNDAPDFRNDAQDSRSDDSESGDEYEDEEINTGAEIESPRAIEPVSQDK